MKKQINFTEMINIDDMDKIVPVACSWCNKIYYLKKWKMEEGKSTGMLRGICPECEEKQKKEKEEEKAKNK